MIINSVIAGAGGSGIDINFQTLYPTTGVNVTTLFTTYDIRFKYKNSILFIYSNNYQMGSISSNLRGKFIMIANATNYSQDYVNIAMNKTNQDNYNWYAIFNSGTKVVLPHSDFTADATTGRITYTGNVSWTIASNGCCIAVWEIPIHPQNTDELIIDTTPWGTA